MESSQLDMNANNMLRRATGKSSDLAMNVHVHGRRYYICARGLSDVFCSSDYLLFQLDWRYNPVHSADICITDIAEIPHATPC
jgi:hypothetical protein